jgi:uncharacterized protein YndB with AHSA1/START domain/predicted SnoaL-like aldol condensation-catalyzing enzyme
MSTADRLQVCVARQFTAAPERVFDAFLNPAKAGKFMFATPGGQMVKVEVDGRVGGRFLFVERRDGEDVAHTGEYVVIERPRRLVFTLSVEKYGQRADQVEISINPDGRGCELTLTHSMTATETSRRQSIEQGWSDILERLARAVAYKEIAVSFLHEVAAGRVREAYDRFVAEDFRHHNTNFRGDRRSLMDAMADNAAANPHKALTIKLAIEEGEYVAVHSHVRQNPQDRGGAVVHIFRFEKGRIAEFWDIGQAIPEHVANENGPF